MAGGVLELRVVSNPVLQGLLARLRDKNTPRPVFREAMELAGMLLGYEAATVLPVEKGYVETPLGRAEALRVREEDVVVVAVLRAALPMAWGVLRVLPGAELGLVAARRLEDTGKRVGGSMVFEVETGYWRLPRVRERHVVLVDPMLATGSTAAKIAEALLEKEPSGFVSVSLIATRQGLGRLEEVLRRRGYRGYAFTAAVDPVLDDKGFIVPGLGDAGDRALGEPED